MLKNFVIYYAMFQCSQMLLIVVMLTQERIMTSFLFGREEEERVTGKILKQAESPACTINRTRFRTSSQFHDLRPHNAVLPP